MSRKTFVIDTNVLLYDPRALLKFKDNDVVIPVTVLEELGSHKRYRDELGKNARIALRILDSLKERGEGDLHHGVLLDTGTNIHIPMSVPPSLESPGPSHSKIVMTAYHLMNAGKPVVFVSKDFVSRVKAEALGIEVEDYENLKESYDAIHKGIRKINVEKRSIDEFFRDGFVKLDPAKHSFYANEYALLNSPEQSSVVSKYQVGSGALGPLLNMNKPIWGIKPLNVEQQCAMDLLLRDDIKLVVLVGQAGTGKTLLAVACGLQKVFDEAVQSKIIVSRPIIPLGKDIGYLPGDKDEKLRSWMQPIYDNLEFLCSSTGDEPNETLRWVMNSNKIEMEAVAHIRGRTLPKCYIIIDEAQNLTGHEIKTIISRAGKGTKVVLTGDPTQIDNPYLDKDSNGITMTIGKFKHHEIFGHVFLNTTERSELAALAADLM